MSLFAVPAQIAPEGNKNLIQYGVFEDESDFRIHISGVTQRAYFFSTRAAKEWCRQAEARKQPLFEVKTRGILTAKGFLCPVGALPDLQQILIPLDIFDNYRPLRTDNTTAKGKKAVCISRLLLERGLIPVPLKTRENTDIRLDIKGQDIIVSGNLKIQVKYDERAGEKRHHAYATGNLFFQIKECNPFKQY